MIHGGEISSKTDIWPLGLTLWEMMALMPPHTQIEEDTMDDSVTCLDDTVESMADYFSERYGESYYVHAFIRGRSRQVCLEIYYTFETSQGAE